MSNDDDEPTGQYASPPCYMHELDPAFRAFGTDSQTWKDVQRWRVATRKRLIAERLEMSAEARAQIGAKVIEELDSIVRAAIAKRTDPTVLSIYWPFKGEFDLRDWAMDLHADTGTTIALPVVIEKNAAMQFRPWQQGAHMERGIWNIPIPTTTETVPPHIVISPLVGYDNANYRLGYGGGYFDRTLAGMLSAPPLVMGVGYASSILPTIYPQPHDIPMTQIIVR